ncbi:TadE/TadG family type IV pilus assembly protein [bacterium]
MFTIRKFFTNKTKGQAMTEFVILLPLMAFFLLAVVEFSVIAIKAQKLEMAAYYASRLYSKIIIRGIKEGSTMQLYDRRQEVMDEQILPKIQNYLETYDVKITDDGRNKLILVWPVSIKFGLLGYYYIKDIQLKSQVEMENEPLSYGGGRYYEPPIE